MREALLTHVNAILTARHTCSVFRSLVIQQHIYPADEAMNGSLSSDDSRDIKVVYFDLGNVLLHFDHQRACENLARLFKASPEAVKSEVFESGLEDRYESGDISTEAFYEHLCDVFSTRPPLAEVCHAAADIFWVNYPTVMVAGQLKRAGYTTGILSNTCAAHWEFVTDGRYRFLNEFFDHIVLSYEVQSMKPAPEIYRAAIELSGQAPEQLFFMDDRPENVQGAHEAGIKAVHFEHGHRLAEDLWRHGVEFNF